MYAAAAQNNSSGGAGAGLLVAYFVAIWLLSALPLFFIFKKAGKPEWAAVVPIYNWIVLLEIVGRPIWWIILLVIPCVGFVVYIVIAIDLAHSFGRGTGFAVGLVLLSWIFLLVLAFNGDRYVGPAAGPASPAVP